MKIKKPQLKKLTAYVTIFLFILYYFLRFQWGWDKYVLAIYAVCIFFVSSYGLLIISKNIVHNVKRGTIDALIKLLVVYTIILTLYTSYRGGSIAFLYALKDYLAPILIGCGITYIFNKKDYSKLIVFISFLCATVGVIYLYEVYKYVIMNNGYMTYTIGIRDLSSAIHNTETRLSMHTVVSGGLSNYYRFPGPLSHINVTALCLAIGTVLSLSTIRLGYPNYGKILFIICFVSLMISMARTAILSSFIGVTLYLALVYGFKKMLGFFLLVLGLIICVVVFNYEFFSSAVVHMSLERIMKTLFYVLSLFKSILTFDRMYNVIVGSGFTYHGYTSNWFGPLLSEELFQIQLITMYGLIPIIMFITISLRKSLKIIKIQKYLSYAGQDYIIVVACFCVIIVMLASTIHVNALIRPQIYPIYFICLSIISQYELCHSKIQD